MNPSNHLFPSTVSAYADTRRHYDVLDGLRGVAALLVIVYHVFELFPASPVPHGYLAVDFFFVLSGFVLGYAYDSRWRESSRRLTLKGFFLRRLIRLHPMVVAGALIGALTFFAQGAARWDGTPVSPSWVMLSLLCMMLMLPAFPRGATEVRGNGEMFPLNGPTWSLFFEYIGNILYALVLRRLPDKLLLLLTAMMGGLLVWISVDAGFLGVGWSMVDGGFWSGMVRMLFPYCVGLLLSRRFRPVKVSRGFLWSSAALLLVAVFPALGGNSNAWLNGLYDALCVIIVFPMLVRMGASATNISYRLTAACRFLGNLSYPLYLVHYPLFYLYYYYIGFNGETVERTFSDTILEALLLVLSSLLLAYILMRFYDIPLRSRLARKYKKFL